VPRVSVIIPTHRRPTLLAAAIRSVLDQTYQDFEIIVVDDASRDNTEEVVRSFSDRRIRYYAHGRNWRVAAARNTGVLNSTAEIIAFLDDDDEWLPEKLERQVAILNRCDAVTGVVYTGLQKIDRRDGRVIAVTNPTKEGHILFDLRRNCVGTASSIAMRRICFDEVGLFDETIDFGEEYDLWIRIAHAFDFACIPEPLVRYSVHVEQLSTNYELMIRGLERQIQKHVAFFAPYPASLARRYLELGSLHCRTGDMRKGRAAIIQAIRLAPFEAKNYRYLLFSFLGKTVFRAIMRYAAGTDMRRTRRLPPGSVRPGEAA
jgi:glycosyltransferase involved in cell wall biosynthesis